ncbi:MAG: PaaI family thioesterase [Chloroflexi bacterium]|nr:PaaI family thioesterase [Chloroflexota bacterium]
MKDQIVDKDGWLVAMRSITTTAALGFLEIEIVDVWDEGLVMRMPITDKVRQPNGLLHGGICMALAESVASLHACWGVDLSKVVPVGIEINGSHVGSAKNGWIRADGRVIRRSTQLIVHQVDIQHEGRGVLLSTARVTNFYKAIGD